MLEIFLFLLFSFLIGLPFIWLYKLIFRKKKPKEKEGMEENYYKYQFDNSDLIVNQKYLFMENFRLWGNLSDSEREERLQDIKVIFDYGKDHIKEAMIRKGFQPGSKIIDISYFTGLNENGFTISSFLVQHEDGGEIRELSINIDMDKMKFTPTNDHFHSNGKEKYWYLKEKNKGIMKI